MGMKVSQPAPMGAGMVNRAPPQMMVSYALQPSCHLCSYFGFTKQAGPTAAQHQAMALHHQQQLQQQQQLQMQQQQQQKQQQQLQMQQLQHQQNVQGFGMQPGMTDVMSTWVLCSCQWALGLIFTPSPR